MLCFVLGCNKNTTVVPKYQTQAGVIPTVAGAEGKTLVVVKFDTSAVGTKLGDKREGVVLGLGSLKGGEFRLGGDLGQTFAEAFAFQLKEAGFQTATAADANAAKDTSTGACRAVVTGTVSNFTVNMKNKGIIGTDFAGGAKMTLCMKAVDGAVLYEETSDYTADYSKLQMIKSDPNKLADRIVTDMIDQFCKKAEFVAALQKAAGG